MPLGTYLPRYLPRYSVLNSGKKEPHLVPRKLLSRYGAHVGGIQKAEGLNFLHIVLLAFLVRFPFLSSVCPSVTELVTPLNFQQRPSQITSASKELCTLIFNFNQANAAMVETASHDDVEGPQASIPGHDPSPECDPCDVCGASQAWVCALCSESLFCDSCWDQERSHRPRILLDRRKTMQPHEKVPLDIFYRFKRMLLGHGETEYDSAENHRLEAEARWFGVWKKDHMSHDLYTTDRFLDIATDMGAGLGSVEQFPSFVSFVGETGMDPKTFLGGTTGCQPTSQVLGAWPAWGGGMDSLRSGLT